MVSTTEPNTTQHFGPGFTCATHGPRGPRGEFFALRVTPPAYQVEKIVDSQKRNPGCPKHRKIRIKLDLSAIVIAG